MTQTLKNLLKEKYNIQIIKSICNATDLNQSDAKEISKKVDLTIVIGGKNSSNTKKLYEVSKQNCKNVIHIETKSDLNLDYIKKFENIGIIAGASTPNFIIEEIKEICLAL